MRGSRLIFPPHFYCISSTSSGDNLAHKCTGCAEVLQEGQLSRELCSAFFCTGNLGRGCSPSCRGCAGHQGQELSVPGQGFCAGVLKLPGLKQKPGKVGVSFEGDTCTHPLPTGAPGAQGAGEGVREMCHRPEAETQLSSHSCVLSSR